MRLECSCPSPVLRIFQRSTSQRTPIQLCTRLNRTPKSNRHGTICNAVKRDTGQVKNREAHEFSSEEQAERMSPSPRQLAREQRSPGPGPACFHRRLLRVEQAINQAADSVFLIGGQDNKWLRELMQRSVKPGNKLLV